MLYLFMYYYLKLAEYKLFNMVSEISFALYILIVACLFIGVFSYKKLIENKPIEYYDDCYFVENGCLGKKYI